MIHMPIFPCAFFPELPKQGLKDSPDSIILESFISADILLVKTFLVLIVCLVVRNNLCAIFFFLFILNIAPALFFPADLNFFNCAFVS